MKLKEAKNILVELRASAKLFKDIYNLNFEDYLASFGDNEVIKNYLREMYKED